MHFFHIAALSMADIAKPQEQVIAMQQNLMFKFYASAKEYFRQRISGHNVHSPICGTADTPSWEGICCSGEGFVYVVDHSPPPFERSCDNGNFNLDFLAPTVEDVNLYYSNQKYAVITRSLPAHLEILNMGRSHIYGTFDVEGLPQSIRKCFMGGNAISGNVHLVHIPRALEEIDFASNKFDQRVVYYSDLPESFHKACFSSTSVKKFLPLLVNDTVNPNIRAKGRYLIDVQKENEEKWKWAV